MPYLIARDRERADYALIHDGALLGRRSTRSQCERYAEACAGRRLTWTRTTNGEYESDAEAR